MKNKQLVAILIGVNVSASLFGCNNIIGKEPLKSEISFEEVNKEIIEKTEDDDINIEQKNIDTTYLILVNKQNYLDKDYVPDNLTYLDIKFSGAESSRYLCEEVAIALKSMIEAAKEDGIYLIGRSGYRSYSTQQATYASKVSKWGQEQADKFSAKAGASEHQTGLAIDIISTEYSELHTNFQYTNTYKWLIEHCSEYGFILRYPKGKSEITGYNFEPWHYRYVGIENAKEITNQNLTLEEYLETIEN